MSFRVSVASLRLSLSHLNSGRTVLGAYLVNMIPEKIGRVLIDGVASARQWANEFPPEWLHDWVVDTESTFQWFLRDCSKVRPLHLSLRSPLAADQRNTY